MQDKYPDFLPKWTEAVIYVHDNNVSLTPQETETEILNEFHLRYMKSSNCLTGEAFFNTAAPVERCKECHDFTYEAGYAALQNKHALYMFKQLLAEHLERDHPIIWKKWAKRLK